MTNNGFARLKDVAYSMFLVILVCHCSGAPKKAAEAGSANKPAVTSGNANKPQVYTVLIGDMKFQPDQIAVSKGDTIIWKNNDLVAHNVTEFPDNKWTSSEIPVGESWRMAITESSDYYCSIHPVMKGKIVVK
jgi:plastocyanin